MISKRPPAYGPTVFSIARCPPAPAAASNGSPSAAAAGAARHGGYPIDAVALLKPGGPGPTVADEVVPRKKLAWEKEMGGPAAANRLARGRLGGWPERLLADKRALPKSDREFLER